MCGVIVVDAEHFDLLVADAMPIYMIMPRCSHNYALFYQLLDSNITVGEQITAEQLIEKRIVMRISMHDHVYRHHSRDK